VQQAERAAGGHQSPALVLRPVSRARPEACGRGLLFFFGEACLK
jgi:hypothetical protein